jgi:anthranilate phosphoribosyltransferase
VHVPYTRVYAMLARHSGFDSCLLVRGVEGGVIPSLRQKGRMYYYHDRGEEQAQEFDPADIGIHRQVRATPLPDDLPARPAGNGDEVGAAFDVDVAARLAAEAGIAALSGEPGSSYDALVYAGAIALWHLKKFGNLADAAARVREVLDSGKAMQRLQSARD